LLLIFISWLYIFSITSIISVGINSTLKLNRLTPSIQLFLGFFYITIYTSIWAFFYRVNWEFHVILFIVSALIFSYFKENIFSFYKTLKYEFNGLTPFLKFIFFSITILALAKSATSPYLIDNESYYIQTIKWINEYGFVKGLVNLHPFLGQTSGWHILQSAFNFSFLYDKFNDINGIALIIANFFSLVKLNDYYNGKREIENLIIGLFPLSNLFFFQFVSAPSPDIPVYIISFFIFYLFIKLFEKLDTRVFIALSTLSIYVVLIKLTTLPLILFTLILIFKYFNNLKSIFPLLLTVSLLTLIVFLAKNIIITGNPIFPVSSPIFFNASWTLPASVSSFYYDVTKLSGYFVTKSQFQELGTLELFTIWIKQSKLHGLFNKLITILLIIAPIILYKLKAKKAISIIYIISIVNMLFLAFTSPQYRFFFNFIQFLTFLTLSFLVKTKKHLNSLIVIGTIIVTIPLFLLSNLKGLTKNNFHLSNPTFTKNQILIPFPNSKYSKEYETIDKQKITFNSPTNLDFFWGTGDLPIPALNKKQYDWFKDNYNIVPQMRTGKLNDGFYSKLINK
jgi:hypothetical protein